MVKKQNRILIALLLLMCMVLSAIPSYAQETINVQVNNNAINFDQQPIVENGRTLVPLRAIFESLGAEVDWDSKTQTIVGTKGDTTVTLVVGNTTATVNDNVVELDVPPKIINDRALVPARFIAESLNCFVGWQEKTKTVYITDGNSKPQRSLSVHYIDVGQADSILILLPNGQNMLIDGGNNADGPLVVDYIKNQGIGTLDFVVATHPHEDHIGGLDTVINTFNIGEIYMPKVSHTTKTFEDLLNAIQNKGLKINSAKDGINIMNSNGLCIDIVAPVADSYADLNDYSVVIKITYLNNAFLFMGDAEELSENQITADVKSDVLKVGHHGSNTSTSESFLKKVAPQHAVISVGNGNSYGHPSQAILTLLNSYGINVYRTDEVGTIIATSDGNNITIDKNASAIQANAPPAEEIIRPTVQQEQQDEVSQIVYVTKTGSKYHRDNCRSLSKSKIPMSLSEAKLKFGPCARCNPPR